MKCKDDTKPHLKHLTVCTENGWTLSEQITIKSLAVQNSSIGHLVCPSGTTNNQSLHNTTERPRRLVTFETFDQKD